ncbi:MAG: efflux RND transporter periplasmic adaptor subunit [Candidatus Krumholzibacteriota bacterium]|nr:efflux RND transporter periplasmic adaptor subunit [Candidatus Krumholzibacteriota bacterium]
MIKNLKELKRTRPGTFHIIIFFAIILAAVLIFLLMMATKKDVKKRRSTLPVPAVSTVRADAENRRIILSGEGTVKPLRMINLVPQVSGKVVSISDAFADGGEVEKDEILLKIEDSDYRIVVKSAEANIMDLESRLQMAFEEAEAAKEEWSLGRKGGGDPPPLVAKEPQLAAARSALTAGKANLEKALLNLERTRLKAPFKGRISSKNVDIGQFVSPGQAIAAMYSIDEAEITVPMRDEDLFWLSVPGFTTENEPGSPATVNAEIAGQKMSWPAKIVRAEGIIDSKTRMVNLVVRVDDPYESTPPLAMGLFTSVRFEGKALDGVIVLPRSSIHNDDTVWIVDENGRLRFRKVKIARFEGNSVWITSGLDKSNIVVTSEIKAVTDSMKVNFRSAKGITE